MITCKDCRIVGTGEQPCIKGAYIELCPLHADAPRLLEACKKATKALESIRRNKKVICDALRACRLLQGPSTIAGWERNLVYAERLVAELEEKP